MLIAYGHYDLGGTSAETADCPLDFTPEVARGMVHRDLPIVRHGDDPFPVGRFATEAREDGLWAVNIRLFGDGDERAKGLALSACMIFGAADDQGEPTGPQLVSAFLAMPDQIIRPTEAAP